MEHRNRMLLEKSYRDVCLVRQLAVAVFTITPDGHVEFIENKNPRLGVIAITGPPENRDEYQSVPHDVKSLLLPNEVLLDEIGVGRGKPLNHARGINCRKHNRNIASRRKLFSLSKKQYDLVAPQIWTYLFVRTCEIVAIKWRTYDQGFNIKFMVRYVGHNRRRFFWKEAKSSLRVPRGLFYSVTSDDENFIADINAVSFKTSLKLFKRSQRGLVRTIDFRLTTLKRERMISIWESEVDRIIKGSKLSGYFKSEAIRNFRKLLPKKYRINNANGFYWQQIQRAYVDVRMKYQLPKPKLVSGWRRRVGDIEIALVTRARKKKYIVFEVFPKLGESFHDSKYAKDVPF